MKLLVTVYYQFYMQIISTIMGGVDVRQIKEENVIAGAKLKEYRKQTGLSIFKVGRQIGVSGSYISQVENGKRPASDSMLVAMAELYGVDKKELFALYDKMPNDEISTIMQHPELRQLFLDVTNDKKFNPEKLSKVIEEFRLMAKEYEDEGEHK